MPRKLKTFVTSIGFFDLAIAAPSMKAAAEAWGADPDIFRQGHAEQTDDPAIVKATLASPGIVLKRPVGSNGKFVKDAALPKTPKPKAKTGEDKKNQREQAMRERLKERAEADLAKARKRHEEEVRSLEKRRDQLAEAENRENERWEKEQQAYREALETVKT